MFRDYKKIFLKGYKSKIDCSISLDDLSSLKKYSEFIMKVGILGFKNFDMNSLIYMVSRALETDNIEFLDILVLVIESNDILDSAMKKHGKRFLNLCGKYIAKNYHRLDKTYFTKMCRVVSAVSGKYQL